MPMELPGPEDRFLAVRHHRKKASTQYRGDEHKDEGRGSQSVGGIHPNSAHHVWNPVLYRTGSQATACYPGDLISVFSVSDRVSSPHMPVSARCNGVNEVAR